MSNARRARSIIAGAAALLLLLVTQANAAPSSMTKFIGGPGVQSTPGANTSYIGWESSRPGTRTFDVWVEPLPIGSGAAKRLNPSGFQGYFIGISQDKNEAIYARWSPRTGQDLWIVPDLTMGTQARPPAGVNTRWAEAYPSISNNFILFTRITNKYTYVILYDRNASTFTTIRRQARGPRGCVCAYSGSVTDRYATWTKCSPRYPAICGTSYYDSMTGNSHPFPNRSAPSWYGGVISETTGYMYAMKSGNACGKRPRVVRWKFGTTDPPTTIGAFPSGMDTYGGLVVTNDGVSDTLYVPVLSCTTFNGDIYRITSADT
jgi:hypothetical protein